MNITFFVFFLPLAFYLIIPVAGGFFVRKRWRKFRRTVINSLKYPEITFESATNSSAGDYYRFYGNLDSFSNSRTAWVRNKNLTVKADLSHCRVFRSFPVEKNFYTDKTYSNIAKNLFQDDSNVESITMNDFMNLPEGTTVFMTGSIVRKPDSVQFTGTGLKPLILIVYEGEKNKLIPAAIWGGRQSNEYWNPVTPWSLGTGSLLCVLFINIVFRNPSFRHLLKIFFSEALLPFLIFLPPGVIFFILFLYYWRKARFCRAKRDLILLLRLSNNSKGLDLSSYTSLPDIDRNNLKMVKRRAFVFQLISLINIVAGLTVNFFLTNFILSYFIK